MRYITCVLIYFSLLVSSCSHQKGLKFSTINESGEDSSYYIDEFVDIEGKILELDTTLIRPRYLAIYNDKLIVGSAKEGNLIQEFSMSGKLVNSFLPKGSGPVEAMSVGGLKVLVNSDCEETLFALDKMLKRGYFFSEFSHQEFNLKNLYLEMVPISKSKFIVQELDSDNRFGLLNLEDETINSFGLSVEHDASNTSYILSQAFQGHGTVSEDKSRFIFASKLTDRIEIYNLNNFSLISLTRGPIFYEPIFEEVQRGEYSVFSENNDGRFSYIDIDVGKNHFYLLFSGDSREENPGKAHYGKQIFVLDYSGKIIKILKLDHPLLDFEVDEDNSIIYGIDVNTYSDEKIIVFALDI